MSNDFDPRRAAAGEPIEAFIAPNWVGVAYVGLTRQGVPVVETPDGRVHVTSTVHMKPPRKWALVFVNEAQACRALQSLITNYEGYDSVYAQEMPE